MKQYVKERTKTVDLQSSRDAMGSSPPKVEHILPSGSVSYNGYSMFIIIIKSYRDMCHSAVRPRWKTYITQRYYTVDTVGGFKTYSTLFIVSIFSLLCAKIRRFILFHFIDETSVPFCATAIIGNTSSHKIKVKEFGPQLPLGWVTIKVLKWML